MRRQLIDYGREGRALIDVPVLDAHGHLGGMSGWNPPPLQQQVKEMERLGVDRAVLSSSLAVSGAVREGNDALIEALERYPDRLLGYCHVSGNYPELMVPELERCFALEGFVGIKIYQVGCPYDSDRFAPAYEFAAGRGVPVLAHTWGGNIGPLEGAAEAHPQVNFMAAHAGSGFAYQQYIDAARRHDNFYLDITLSRERTNQIEHFVEEVGADRIVWGSDAPCFSMSHQLGKVLFARIPENAKRAMLHDTAARLFGDPLGQ